MTKRLTFMTAAALLLLSMLACMGGDETPVPTEPGATATATIVAPTIEPTATQTPPPMHLSDNLLPWSDVLRETSGWSGGSHWVMQGWEPLYYDLAYCETMEQAWHEDLPGCRMCQTGEPEIGCTPTGYDWSLWHTPEFASARCDTFDMRCHSGPEAQRIFFQDRLGYAGIQTTIDLPANAETCYLHGYVMMWHTDDADDTHEFSRVTVYNENGSVNVQATNDARESMWFRAVVYPLGGGARAQTDWFGWDDDGGTFSNPICQPDDVGNCGFGVYDRWQEVDLQFDANGVPGVTVSLEMMPTFANHNQDGQYDDWELRCMLPDEWEPDGTATPNADYTPTPEEMWEPLGIFCVPDDAGYTLNVRSEPGTQYSVIGQIEPGECVNCYHLVVYADGTPQGWDNCQNCDIWCATTDAGQGYAAILKNGSCLGEYTPWPTSAFAVVSGAIRACLP